ncbi:MAG TPA: hypothetical protein VKV36_10805 [Acidimicrobiales bacterium]|nr:hypothetical protein [Acidimicrobiales bacterium]
MPAAQRRAHSQRADHDQELAVVNAGITKTENAIEHLPAFEAGTLSESQSGEASAPAGAGPVLRRVVLLSRRLVLE